MSNLKANANFGALKISQIVIPGVTHGGLTSVVHSQTLASAFATSLGLSSEFPNYSSDLITAVANHLVVAQNLTFKEELKAGARFFDLRVGYDQTK